MKMNKKYRSDQYFPYLLILPTVLLIVLFMFYPITQVVNLSLQDYSTNSFSGVGNFIGLENFKKLLTGDKVFSKAFGVSLKWVVAEIISQVILGMGIALLLNQKVTPQMLAKEENKEKLEMMIKTFFNRLDGYHVQYNVVSRDTLIDAQKHPEKHKDLIVRVAGYSAFLNVLSKATQDDIIGRTEQIL